ncbi:MAG: DMT family transporter [Planctomycetota bacterium]|nr:DMT family transporter [Planctomycetota bacterium]
MGIGETAGLASAAIWSISSLLYSYARMTAWELNYWKNVFTTFIFLVHLWIVRNYFEPGPLFEAPLEAWCWLGLSSVVGIVVGDTVYLRSLQILGARRALVVATASPIFGVLIGFFFMQDLISVLLVAGVGLTVFGVGIVVGDKKAEVENPNVYPGKFMIGVSLGVGAALCQASGVAFAKLGMAHGCEALESSFIRIFTAAVAMTWMVVMYPERYALSEKPVVKPQGEPGTEASEDEEKVATGPDSLSTEAPQTVRASILKPLTEWYSMKFFIPGVLMGTWIGIWFFQMAQQYTDTAVVTTLVSTCPIFAIPLVWLVQGHRVSLQGILGTGIAVLGIYLVVSQSS